MTRSVSFGRCDGSPLASGAAPRVYRPSMSHTQREDIVKIVFSAQGGDAPARSELRPMTRAQPQLASGAPIPSSVSIETAKLPLTHRQDRIRVQGVARGRDGLLDVRVLANERKVLYRRASPPVAGGACIRCRHAARPRHRRPSNHRAQSKSSHQHSNADRSPRRARGRSFAHADRGQPPGRGPKPLRSELYQGGFESASSLGKLDGRLVRQLQRRLQRLDTAARLILESQA